ncbi:gas vesicle protein GvpG [Amycolatopsis rhabdoformis]|uniref:Gas vesicle protein GvpG n=1 Tax=Amycolatopsis rhabdoformis TaxID=1448059 RepID=A0ABZ1ILN2_9PSEU|nr:gas vesicle protein GvpG [Amycolatopsis rhabdoformis]WSE34671.1 gas vesicle protein GvpG [Amycolatopsis rhabdoformis]
MGLVTGILGLPLLPVRGVLALGELIRRRVEEEAHDPATVRRELEAVHEARAAGEISAEEEAEAQQRVLDRLTGAQAGRPVRRRAPEDRKR